MKITKRVNKKSWTVKVSFDGYSYTDGKGPFYLAGSFNDWNVADAAYKVETKANKSLKDFSIKALDKNVDTVEFKIWNGDAESGYWVEYDANKDVYENCENIVRNDAGTFNLVVKQD